MRRFLATSILATFGLVFLIIPFQNFSPVTPGKLRFVGTYLQVGPIVPNGDFLSEMDGTWGPKYKLSNAVINAYYFQQIQNTLKIKAIVDVHNFLFDGKRDPATGFALLDPAYEQNLNRLYTSIQGNLDKIDAFYVIDEPAVNKVPIEALNQSIKALKARFPGIPTLIVFDASCFDNAPTKDSGCGMAGHRGIPDDLDWVGFDWYLGALGSTPNQDAEYFDFQIVQTLRLLESQTKKPIVLVGGGMDYYLKSFAPNWAYIDSLLYSRMQRYLALAKYHPQVIGLLSYAWAGEEPTCPGSNPASMNGTRCWPSVRQLLWSTYQNDLAPEFRQEVFNARFYLDNYPDLKAAFGPNNLERATQHWYSNGMAEGRQGSKTFNSRKYLSRYPDLQNAFGTTNWPQAIRHYIQYGMYEGRNPL